MRETWPTPGCSTRAPTTARLVGPGAARFGRRGDGRARGAALALAARRDEVQRAALLSFRHGRDHAGGLGADWLASALDQIALRLGLLPTRRAARGDRGRAGCGSCSSCPARCSGVLVDRGDDGQLHRPARARAAGGRSATASTPTRRARRRCRSAGDPARAATSTRAPSRRWRCSASAGRTSRKLAARRRRARSTSRRCERELATGEPAIVIANAGEVNAGDFDPIAEMADAGAASTTPGFTSTGPSGCSRGCRPRTRTPAREGIEHADSVTVDAHKWLNVPYDSGFAFVRDACAARAGARDRRAIPALRRTTPGRTRAS